MLDKPIAWKNETRAEYYFKGMVETNVSDRQLEAKISAAESIGRSVYSKLYTTGKDMITKQHLLRGLPYKLPFHHRIVAMQVIKVSTLPANIEQIVLMYHPTDAPNIRVSIVS